MRVLFIGDVVGRPGRQALAVVLPRWREAHRPDVVIANGENAAGGMGITAQVAEDLFRLGIDILTLGNHTFRQKDAAALVDAESRVLRPANYPPGVPGRGAGVFRVGETSIAVVNLLGRVFMDPLDDPFRAAEELIPLLREQTLCILVDMHAEATSEKAALAWMLDGQVSAVIGTHTHVPTADARVLPGGTAFITDVGMVGPRDSVLGVRADIIISRFRTGMPARFDLADGPVVASAVLIEIAPDGHADGITALTEVVSIAPADGNSTALSGETDIAL